MCKNVMFVTKKLLNKSLSDFSIFFQNIDYKLL